MTQRTGIWRFGGMLFGMSHTEAGDEVLPDLSATELRVAFEKRRQKNYDGISTGEDTITVRFEVVLGRDYLVSMAPPVTPTLKQKLDETFAKMKTEAERDRPAMRRRLSQVAKQLM